MKRHLKFTLFFSAIILLFLGKLIFMKAAFLGGDYHAQFYPWSKFYSESIKNFAFPFWIDSFHSGFPLVAEGQVGNFYPLNIVMFFILPFRIAYNYLVILHFALAGIFTYIYARRIGAGEWGGVLSALIFCFGSAYAGCFYNIITLKTLAWFPLALYIMEIYFDSKSLKYLTYFGIVLGMQLLAGFAQVAFYSAIFYVVYFVYGLFVRKELKLRDIFKVVIAFLIAGVIFYPQFILSLNLAEFSSRSEATAGFALWGSFLPFNLISLYFPSWIFHGTKAYIGILSILFLIMALCNLKREPKLRPLFVIMLLSIFLAMGAYNPLYVLFLKLTKFYAFRNPSKFLFFGIFAASVLSGWGFDKFFDLDSKGNQKTALRIFMLFTGGMLSFFLLIKVSLYIFKNRIMDIGRWYVTSYIAGKEHHRHSLDTYLERIGVFYQHMVDKASFTDIFIIISVLFCIVALIISWYLLKRRATPAYKGVFIVLICIEIYVFSLYGTGFRGNIKPFEYLRPTHTEILDILSSDNEAFRIAPFGLTDEALPLWARPNTNAIFGLDSIAAYTPLVEKDYKEYLLPLEIVDDSLGFLSPKDNALSGKYQDLRLLNVKYIVSSRKLRYGFLEEITSCDGAWLYKLKDYLPRVFFTCNIEGDIRKESIDCLRVADYKSGFICLEVSAGNQGFVVFSENYYPGWSVSVDGEEKEIILVKNIVQAVKMDKGEHQVIFRFKPEFITRR